MTFYVGIRLLIDQQEYSQPQNFDLIITDMTIPNRTGAELAERLLEIRPDIPIILCTGFSEMINEEKAKEIGISAFIMKPIVMREMAKKIRETLNEAKEESKANLHSSGYQRE